MTGKYEFESWETKEGIIDFLEENGFKRIEGRKSSEIIGKSEQLGDVPVYAVGDYTSDPTSHWIKFYSPKWRNRILFCRENKIVKNINSRSSSVWSVIVGESWNDFNDFDSFREIVREKLGI
jgi:hypothetical protein